MNKAILGPVLSDVASFSDGKKFILASAFYSEDRLDALEVGAKSIEIMVRLDLNSVDGWVNK